MTDQNDPMTDAMDAALTAATGSPTGRSPIFGRPASRPYAGGTGSTGSGASHDRREREDEHGVSAYRQEQIIGALRAAGTTGLTWSELGTLMGWHHGQATGALSVLHKEREIEALDSRRKRSTIYVLREFIAGRPTRDPGTTRGNRILAEANVELNRENGALNQRVMDLQTTVAERDALLDEQQLLVRKAFGERDDQIALAAGAEARARSAEQAAALAVEQMTRVDDERARVGEELATLRRERAEHLLDIETLTRENHALRIARALTQLSDEEREVWDKVAEALQTHSTYTSEQPIRVRMGTIRTLWTALARQAAPALPTRARPGLQDSAESAGPDQGTTPET